MPPPNQKRLTINTSHPTEGVQLNALNTGIAYFADRLIAYYEMDAATQAEFLARDPLLARIIEFIQYAPQGGTKPT